MNEKTRLIAGTSCTAVIACCLLFSVLSPAFASWGEKISTYYITEGWQKLKTTNVVTSIVWDFRGYDTLGEESVLFTALIGVLALGFGLHARHKIHHKVKE